MTLKFVTSNKHKFREAKEIAKSYGVLLDHINQSYEEIQSEKLEKIAKNSAKEIFKNIKKPCFVEDAGLFIEELDGFPGPYSSFVFKKIGNDGILKLMNGKKNRRSNFKSVSCYYSKSKKGKLFVGKTIGKITTEKRGSKGFGYDPIFSPNNQKKTFGEMSQKNKNDFSHRGKSIEKLVKWYAHNKESDGE